MRSARVAEWILSLVLLPDRAASTVGDWMENADARGPIWFWSAVFRTVVARAWSDFMERPGFMVGLALRGWLYTGWLILGTGFLLMLGFWIVVIPTAMFGEYLARHLHWHPNWPPLPGELLVTTLAMIWIGWCYFKAGRWIARRAPGKELAAGIIACISPAVIWFVLGSVAEHFWGTQIDLYLASHQPANPSQFPDPFGILLLAGIIWSRHKSLRNIAQ